MSLLIYFVSSRKNASSMRAGTLSCVPLSTPARRKCLINVFEWTNERTNQSCRFLALHSTDSRGGVVQRNMPGGGHCREPSNHLSGRWTLSDHLSLSSQMTEGRRCQVHLLDDRKLELLVQVNDFWPTFWVPSETDVVQTWTQLRDGGECKLFSNPNLLKSVRGALGHTLVFVCVWLLFSFIPFLCTPPLRHSRPHVHLTYCCKSLEKEIPQLTLAILSARKKLIII